MRQNTHLTHTQYIGLNISLMYGHHNKTGTVFVALDWSEVDVVKNPKPNNTTLPQTLSYKMLPWLQHKSI